MRRKQMNEERAVQITRLQTEEESLQSENLQVVIEIQQLKLKLPNLPDIHEEHIRQIHRQLFEEEMHCSEMQKKLPDLYRDMNTACQVHCLCKKIAEDVNKELERTTSYYHSKNLFHEKRVQEKQGSYIDFQCR